jgi:hypothetical protein
VARRDEDIVDIHMSAIGRYENEVVKRNGEWLIGKRRRTG